MSKFKIKYRIPNVRSLIKGYCTRLVSGLIDIDDLARAIDPSLIADEVDHEAVAYFVDCSEVMFHMSYECLAAEIELDSLASHIVLDELAPEICLSELAGYIDECDIAPYLDIDYSEIDVCYSALVDSLDYDVLADSISTDSDACREIADKVNAKVIASHVQDPWSMMVTPFEKEH